MPQKKRREDSTLGRSLGGEAEEEEDFIRYQPEDDTIRLTGIMMSQDSQIVELKAFARYDREALDAEKKLGASEKAMYEARIASMEALRATEVEWINSLTKYHLQKDRIIITTLTSSIDKEEETVALLKSQDDQMKAQCELIVAYMTQIKRGVLQMAETANMYRTSLTIQANKHQIEMVGLDERVAALVDADGYLKADLSAKDAEIARLKEKLVVSKRCSMDT